VADSTETEHNLASDGRVRSGMAALFAVGALPKLGRAKPLSSLWGFYGLPQWTLPATGVIELATGIALARPSTAKVGGALSLALMAGATLTNLRHRRSWPLVPVTLGVGALALQLARSQETPSALPG
jgi:hypothetical protein